MMIGWLDFLIVGHLVPVYMAVFLMVIDAQVVRAVWEQAFPALG
jgi:hypothetical protein